MDFGYLKLDISKNFSLIHKQTDKHKATEASFKWEGGRREMKRPKSNKGSILGQIFKSKKTLKTKAEEKDSESRMKEEKNQINETGKRWIHIGKQGRQTGRQWNHQKQILCFAFQICIALGVLGLGALRCSGWRGCGMGVSEAGPR